MSKRKSNDFTAYDLSDEDAEVGARFNGLQRQYLQNILADSATHLVNLEYTPNDTESFAYTHAQLTARVKLLRSLLT